MERKYAFAAALGGLVPSVLFIQELNAALERAQLPADCRAFLDAVFWLDASAIYAHLRCMGESGRVLHLAMYKLDLVVFPMVYGTLYFCAIAYLWPRVRVLRYAALATVCFDTLLENVGTVFLLRQFPERNELVERCVSIGNRGKYVGLIASMLLIVVGALRRCLCSSPQRADPRREEKTKAL
uniref:Uncharacterized protein n=1 Tax=Globisporangium ultimum (strain ATCC 200006 / CBS 805.95 / DAOM BR144) TaxID=431595 RepID=K3XAV6_GLOUD